jgi:hypothetical protein
VLDSVVHRDLKRAKLTGHAMSSTMHACFLAAARVRRPGYPPR